MLLLLAESLVSYEKLTPIAIFGFFTLIAWWMMNLFAAGKPRAESRLDEMRNPVTRKKLDEAVKKNAAVAKMLEAATPLARPLQPKSEEDIGKLRSRLMQAGFRSEGAPSVFLGLKFAGLMIGLFLGGGGLLITQGATQKTMVNTVLAAGLMFYLPDIINWFIAKSRKDAIFYTLPDALDLLVVCVEAGLGLDQAMRKVADEMKKNAKIICEEFALCNLQLQMGRSRVDVLHELGGRTGVDDLRSLAAVLIQADKFGSSVAQALRVQSDAMRTRRRQLAEEKAAKTAVKLIFPLVIFIFPAIFVVLVGPAAITIVNDMFPMMAAGK